MLEATQGGEGSNGVGKRTHSAQSQPGCHADHVALSDADVQKPAGKLAREFIEDLKSKLAGEQHNSRLQPRCRGHPGNKRRPQPLISSNARCKSWSLGGR